MKTLSIFIVLIAVAVGAVWYWSRPAQAPENGQIVTPTPVIQSPATSASPSAVPSASEPKSVSMINFSFAPSMLTVKRGDKVIFTNKDAAPHDAVAAGKFDSGTLQKGQTYLLDTAALTPGTYPYVCTFHPSMRGTLIVQ